MYSCRNRTRGWVEGGGGGQTFRRLPTLQAAPCDCPASRANCPCPSSRCSCRHYKSPKANLLARPRPPSAAAAWTAPGWPCTAPSPLRWRRRCCRAQPPGRRVRSAGQGKSRRAVRVMRGEGEETTHSKRSGSAFACAGLRPRWHSPILCAHRPKQRALELLLHALAAAADDAVDLLHSDGWVDD